MDNASYEYKLVLRSNPIVSKTFHFVILASFACLAARLSKCKLKINRDILQANGLVWLLNDMYLLVHFSFK